MAAAGPGDPAVLAILEALREVSKLTSLATHDYAARLASHCRVGGPKDLVQVLAAIREAGAKVADLEAAGEVLPRSRLVGIVSGFVKAPRRPNAQPEVQRTPGYQATEERRRAEHHAAVRADPTAQMFDMFGTDDLPTEERP